MQPLYKIVHDTQQISKKIQLYRITLASMARCKLFLSKWVPEKKYFL